MRVASFICVLFMVIAGEAAAVVFPSALKYRSVHWVKSLQAIIQSSSSSSGSGSKSSKMFDLRPRMSLATEKMMATPM